MQTHRQPSEKAVLAIGGDVALSRTVAQRMGEHGAGWVFARLRARLAGADLFTFNFESPVLPRGASPRAKALVVPEALLLDGPGPLTDGLPPMALNLANNHQHDAGPGGTRRTMAVLDRLGIARFGAGVDDRSARACRILRVNGLRVGLLGRTEDCPQVHGKGYPGPALMRYPQMVRDVRSAARRCDCLVVHLHQGVEFVDWPAPHMVRLCRELVRAGARIVVAGHPHVPQGIERVGRGLIFYSLGNLVFDVAHSKYLSKGSPWTNRSVVAMAPVTKTDVGEPKLVPYRIDSAGRPAALHGKPGAEVVRHIAEISKDLSDAKAIQRRWRQTALRYLGINIRWAADGLDGGASLARLADSFFARLAHDENRQWVRELFARAAWARRINRPPWT